MMDMSYSIRPADQEALKNSIFETFAIDLGTSGLVADIREAIADANSILYICLLNRAVPFFVNATAHLPLGYCEYLRVSSYTGETQGEISMTPMSKETLSRKYDAVIIFDDICDSGNTLKHVKEYVCGAIPDVPVYTAVLLYRQLKNRAPALEPDFKAITTNRADFFYGYGMDADGFGRNAPFITK